MYREDENPSFSKLPSSLIKKKKEKDFTFNILVLSNYICEQ